MIKTFTVSLRMAVQEFPEEVISEEDQLKALYDLLAEGLYQVGAGREGDTLNDHGAGVHWFYTNLNIISTKE
jgi:hypothetical protein